MPRGQIAPRETVYSRKWAKRSFFLRAPLRTSSAETLPTNIQVTTTGYLSKSRWFVEVWYYIRYHLCSCRKTSCVMVKDGAYSTSPVPGATLALEAYIPSGLPPQ